MQMHMWKLYSDVTTVMLHLRLNESATSNNKLIFAKIINSHLQHALFMGDRNKTMHSANINKQGTVKCW